MDSLIFVVYVVEEFKSHKSSGGSQVLSLNRRPSDLLNAIKKCVFFSLVKVEALDNITLRKHTLLFSSSSYKLLNM